MLIFKLRGDVVHKTTASLHDWLNADKRNRDFLPKPEIGIREYPVRQKETFVGVTVGNEEWFEFDELIEVNT